MKLREKIKQLILWLFCVSPTILLQSPFTVVNAYAIVNNVNTTPQQYNSATGSPMHDENEKLI